MQLTSRYVKNIEAMLEHRKISRTQFAKHLGIHRQHASQMLGTEKYPPVEPKLETIGRVAKVLGIAPYALLLPTNKFKERLTTKGE